MDKIVEEIKAALEKLGYKEPIFEVKEIAFHRFKVTTEQMTGIYDTDRHTFVD